MFVKVDLVPLDWIVCKSGQTCHKLLKLIPILESIDDEALYSTPFVDALKEATIILKKALFNYCFVPFVLQTVFTVIYFSFYAMSDE